LWHEEWSDQKNFDTFGKCANPNWHGHNYDLFVTIKGEPSPITGFCMDLKDLSRIINSKVIDKLDHKNLNLDVDFLNGIKSSTENVAIAIWEEIEHDIQQTGCQLHCIKLYETENNYVEYYGGK
jgi:6-pyruvoyltetrahydropterin/6-carboxytetrahydropterin synthase